MGIALCREWGTLHSTYGIPCDGRSSGIEVKEWTGNTELGQSRSSFVVAADDVVVGGQVEEEEGWGGEVVEVIVSSWRRE